MADSVNATSISSFLTGVAIAFVAAYFAYYFQKKHRREELSVIEDSIDFLGSRWNTDAKNLFDNDGLALIVSLTVECVGKSVLLHKCKLSLKSGTKGRKKSVLVGTLYDSRKTIRIERDEVATVRFIFNPSPYAKTLEALILFLTGAIYSLELINIQKHKVGRDGNKRIREVRTLSNKKHFFVTIPPFDKRDEAERAVGILEANGFKGIELHENIVDELIGSSANADSV